MTSIDWATKFIEKDKLNEKLNLEKDKLNEKLNLEKDKRICDAAKIATLDAELKYANSEILMIKQKLSPLGAIEFFEERATSLSTVQRSLSRGDKWKNYYRNDTKGFMTKMMQSFSNLRTMNQENFIADLVKQTYSNSSSFHHSFDLQQGVQISKSDYPNDQLIFLENICDILPCKWTII